MILYVQTTYHLQQERIINDRASKHDRFLSYIGLTGEGMLTSVIVYFLGFFLFVNVAAPELVNDSDILSMWSRLIVCHTQFSDQN
jgi:hypothetical protein